MNVSKGCRDHDEVGSLTITRYKCWSTIDLVAAGKSAHGVTELENRKGSSTGGAH